MREGGGTGGVGSRRGVWGIGWEGTGGCEGVVLIEQKSNRSPPPLSLSIFLFATEDLQR